ncbi:MFS transporter [Corynebacterium bovis]|uniref:MFS transporter n=1 Tax=Corynebacterium bovis TaxID=36808 RepID=UPI00244B10E9|nr:MFS transporter [Corynebacterium bovis]MDH2456384.1 MFS transporter [Corynebacterium bovis]
MSPDTTPDASATRPARNPQATPALLALSLGGFGIGLTEFVIAGLLSEVATDLRVSIPAAGHLVGAYALAVVPGALILTPFLMRRPPKIALVALLTLFIVGNILSAWSPGYAVMVAGRVVAALAHGGYFGIGAVLAGSLVPPSRQASAISIMFAGLTIANVLGVPLGSFIGQHVGWRAVFWIISGVGVLALTGLVALVPHTDPEANQLPVRRQFATLVTPQVLASLITTALVFGGMFGVFTYIEPLLRTVTGFSAGAVPWLLVLFGGGLFLGNVVGGRAADRDPDKAVIVLSILLPVVILGLGAAAAVPWATAALLTLMGAVGFATVPGLQARVMRHAHGASTLASATNIAAFNLGNTVGVSIAGAAIGAGWGFRSPTAVGAGLTVTGLLVLCLAVTRSARRTQSRHRPPHAGPHDPPR